MSNNPPRFAEAEFRALVTATSPAHEPVLHALLETALEYPIRFDALTLVSGEHTFYVRTRGGVTSVELVHSYRLPTSTRPVRFSFIRTHDGRATQLQWGIEYRR